jgi:hypothetical protein
MGVVCFNNGCGTILILTIGLSSQMLQVKSGSFISNLQLRVRLCQDYKIVKSTQDGQTNRQVLETRSKIFREIALRRKT